MKHLFIDSITLRAKAFISKAIFSLSDSLRRKLSFVRYMYFDIYRRVVQILCISILTSVLLIFLSESLNTGVYFFNQTKISEAFIIHNSGVQVSFFKDYKK